MSSFFQSQVERLLTTADIRVNGERPWDLRVHDERLYQRVLLHGSLGLGESYMDGWWDTPHVDEFFTRILSQRLDEQVRGIDILLLGIRTLTTNMQSLHRAFIVGEQHYDLGNDLYEAMLDKRLTYTCGYWKEATTLEQAQEDKLDLICRKLHLKPGQKILDIGCGWGSFAKFAAEKYDVSVTGVTISKEQVALARTLCAGLPVEIILQDYRKIEGKFDHIVSIGMFEHVGSKNYRTYMEIVSRHLKDDGLFLLHTIGHNDTAIGADPWINKYIFPNGMLPSIKQISSAIDNLFLLEDWHNFGLDYDKTLLAWHANFREHWPDLQKHYDERFFRMWNYYLLTSAASFRARKNQLWQMVFSKKDTLKGYQSVR